VDPVRDDRFEQFRYGQLNEIIWQHDLQHLAWQNVVDNPTVVPRVMGRNLLAYLEVRPDLNSGAERLDGRNPAVRTWTLPLFYANLVLGVVGLFRMRRTAAGQLLIVVAGYFVLSSIVFVAAPRVRVPFDLILCLGTASFVVSWLRARRSRTAAAPAAAPSTA